jgi:hypothetical protein
LPGEEEVKLREFFDMINGQLDEGASPETVLNYLRLTSETYQLTSGTRSGQEVCQLFN